MKKIIPVIISVLILLYGCNPMNSTEPSTEPINKYDNKIVDGDIEELWDLTISKYLEYDLWDDKEIYDAGHFLMIPLHYASQNGNRKYIKDFENHFERFISNGVIEMDISNDGKRLDTLHYYYLLSRYVALEYNPEENNKTIDFLANFLLEEVERFWIELPAWQWDRDHFPGGMKERVLWKLENKDVDLSYYRAIIDEELFTLAIAADLTAYFPNNPLLEEITNVAYQIFNNEGRFDSEDRWLFQIGVWADHPDYDYVGYDKKELINGKKTIENISTDSSHFHRFPLWITSLYESYPNDTNEKKLFSNIKKGLEKQFFEIVVKDPSEEFPYYRLTNFMDGNNGIYRWNHPTQNGSGFGPYELTGTFTIGWWTFLGSDRAKKLYEDLAQQYPLPEEAIDLYIGPNTTRDRNIYVADPDFYYNGYLKILALMASQIK